MNKAAIKEMAKRSPCAQRTVVAVRHAYSSVLAVVAPTLAQRYDNETLAVIKRVLGPDSLAIDVGANEGTVLSAICQSAPHARHHAIEPIPALAARLRERFPHCRIHQCAAAEQAGTAEFYIANEMAYSSLEDRSIKDLQNYGLAKPELHKTTVEICTIDELIPTDERVALIKIDVESAEYRTLLGARKLLTREKPVVVFEAGFYSEQRSRELYELFAEAGMSITTMAWWLAGRGDFKNVADYVAAAPRSYYWLAHRKPQ